jgi:tripartite-type tricarboxylate transporter receptor subunit TctC
MNQSLPRRALLAAPLLALPGIARAQGQPASWPPRPVQLLVGYAAGTGIDSVARFYAEQLRQRTGQNFVVVNKVGAYGNIAAAETARAAGDGTTILVTPNTPLTVNPHLIRPMPFDPLRDLAPIGTLARWGFVLLVNPEATPVASIAELTARLKARPGFTYASGNFGGRAAAELYRLGIGAEGTHVAYRSVPQAIVDLLAGRVAFLFADVVAGLPQVRGGKLKALAVTNGTRLAALPEVPTLVESGIAGGEVVSWFAALLPSSAPAEVRAAAAAAFDAVTRSEATRAFLEATAAEPLPGTPEQTTAFIRAETARWGELVQAARIEMD